MNEAEIRDLQVNLRALHRVLRESVPPVEGISRSAVRVLGVVARTGGVQPSAVAEELGMVSSNVAGALRELVSQRYVQRRRVATDGRRTVVSLTDHGSAAVAAHRLLRVADLRDTIEATLSACEQEQLAATIPLLGRLVAARTTAKQP